MTTILLSFAGEDRPYVDEVAQVLHQIGVRVFYDRYEQVDLWGKDLYTHLNDIYQKRSKYCVIFVSAHYAKKLWTNHERESAQARAFTQGSEYILPARFDTTEIPGINVTTGYIDLKEISAADFAYLIAKKVGVGLEIQQMIEFLEYYLGDYRITKVGVELHFHSDREEFDASFPIRLMLEMYRAKQLVPMFLVPAVVPH